MQRPEAPADPSLLASPVQRSAMLPPLTAPAPAPSPARIAASGGQPELIEPPVHVSRGESAAAVADADVQATPQLLSESPDLMQAGIASRHQHRPRDPFQKQRLRPYEIVLAVALILAGLVGLGLLWYYNQDTQKVPAPDGDRANESLLVDPFVVPTEKELAPKPVPAALVGTWELRADDGRTGKLVLSADGRLAAISVAGDSPTPEGDNPLPDYEGHWYLIKQTGDRYVLEFGREHRGRQTYKVTVQLTDPDAFTLVETLKAGVPTGEKHRFIRIAPAPAAKAESP